MKTLLSIVVAVGVSVMFTYYLMRKHNKIHHSKKCGCKPRVLSNDVAQNEGPGKGNPIIVDDPILVGEILDAATGNN